MRSRRHDPLGGCPARAGPASSGRRRFGLNGDYAKSGNPGDFDIDIRNSRDHADEFGTNPLVSRVIIGGTQKESATGGAGFAQWIDVGNFSTDDDAIVLPGESAAPMSFWETRVKSPLTPVDAIALQIGDIVSHEAGHFFGNLHTDVNVNFSTNPILCDPGMPNIMDPGLCNNVRLGPDRLLGTHDDVDFDFGVDRYVDGVDSISNLVSGIEDTLNVIAFGLSTGKVTGTASATARLSADTSCSAGGAGALSALILSAAADSDNLAGPVGLYVPGQFVDRLPEVTSLATVSPGLPTTPAKTAATIPRTALSPALHMARVDRLLAAFDADERHLVSFSPDEAEDGVDLTDEWLLKRGIVALPEG